MHRQLNLKQNLDEFDAFFNMLDESHAGLDRNQSGMLNAQLVLLLANHIGDTEVLRQAFALARAKVEMIQHM
ncbi:DUF2783 domain-containing protein [Oxalobacteraceae bacterium OM1]|nr:DUF2783 domain-containing protein [Oxalobacteraceae bacterium OM1]